MREMVISRPAVAAWKARHRKTDEDIARALGVPYGSWIRWLAGRSTVPAEALLGLSNLTGIAPQDLMEPPDALLRPAPASSDAAEPPRREDAA